MDKPEKNPYRELMEQVNLTLEARERILTNIQQADLSPQPEKVVPFPRRRQTWRRWASLAACLVVVVAVLVAVPLLREQPDTAPPVQVLAGGLAGRALGSRRLPGDGSLQAPLRPCQHNVHRV